MKLWKIMLAVIVAVLMISCVAMADETHTHQWSTPVAEKVSDIYYKADDVHAALYRTKQHCTCGEVKYSDLYEETGSCDYKMGDMVKATCETDAYTIDTCKKCGHQKKVIQALATGHLDINYNKKLTNGDCQTESTWAEVCNDCGKVLTTPVKGAKGNHVYGDVSQLNPDCMTGGWVFKTCTVKGCKDTDPGHTVNEAVPARGYHRWDYANTIIVPPTCVEVGYSLVKCADCGAVSEEFDYVGYAGHDIKWTARKDATCKEDGYKGYGTCKVCAKLFDFETGLEIKAITVLKANENDHEVAANGWTYHITSCTDTRNYKSGTCVVCSKPVNVTIGASEHKFAEAKKLAGKATGVYAGVGVVTKASTCTKTGEGYVVCTVCTQQAQMNVTIPATGHKWMSWNYSAPADCVNAMTAWRVCENAGCTDKDVTIVAPALGHNWIIVEESITATCDKAGICTRKCTNCGGEEYNVYVPATGHTYEEKVTAATCTKDGKIVKTCKVCGDKKSEKIPAAHGATKEVAGKAPACGVAGTIDVICTVCNAKVGEKATAALAHSYSWVVVTKPSEAGNGRNEYKCGLCGDVAEVKTIKFSKMYYNNTMTSFGPTTKELVGGNDWYRVTPVDLTVDGVYTYDLIASNKYIVGKVTITVNAGTLTVSYKANGVDVKDEALLIYASKADLATGTAVTAPVGAAINAAETFGADSKVLVSLILTGDYDAAGKGLVDASAAAGMIANID